MAGSLPRKQFKMVVGWLAFHEEEAYKAWNLAVRGEHFEKIVRNRQTGLIVMKEAVLMDIDPKWYLQYGLTNIVM